MVEQDAVAGVDAVGLAVVHRDPMGVYLGGAVRRTRVERRGLALRHLLHQTEHLAGGGLVEAHAVLQPQDAHGLQQAQRSQGVAVGRVLRRLEAHLHVALRRQVVDLVRLRLLHDADEIGGVREVAVVHEEADTRLVWVLVQVIDAVGVEHRRPALDAVHRVSLAQQQLRQVGAVLSRDPRDQRGLAHSHLTVLGRASAVAPGRPPASSVVHRRSEPARTWPRPCAAGTTRRFGARPPADRRWAPSPSRAGGSRP